jgi:hypothetical protein
MKDGLSYSTCHTSRSKEMHVGTQKSHICKENMMRKNGTFLYEEKIEWTEKPEKENSERGKVKLINEGKQQVCKGNNKAGKERARLKRICRKRKTVTEEGNNMSERK